MSLNIKNIKLLISDSFTELNSNGLIIYNNSENYFKFGTGVSEIKANDLKVNKLTILENLTVLGTINSFLNNVTSNNFTIGYLTVSGQTFLQFGNYPQEAKIICDGDKFNFTKPLNVPSITINNNLIINNIIVKFLNLENNLSAHQSVVIPDGVTYTPGINELFVYVDGLLQTRGSYGYKDYYENTNNSIKFNYNLASGAEIKFVIYKNQLGQKSIEVIDYLTDSIYLVNSIFPIPGNQEYTINSNSLFVYFDGILQTKGVDYIEYSINSIKLLKSLPINTKIVFVIFKGV